MSAQRRPWDPQPHGPIQHALTALGLALGLAIWATGRIYEALTEARDIGRLLAEAWLTGGKRRG